PHKDPFPSRGARRYCNHFTHSDLPPHNGVTDRAYRSLALIHWECVTQLPEYWELLSIVHPRLI
ncbi:hypothetical protein B0H12DRAFT_1188467, partial [Mycena haematopus]